MAAKTGALTTRSLAAIGNVCERLEAREIYWTCQLDLSQDDVFEMIVPDQEDRRALVRAAELHHGPTARWNADVYLTRLCPGSNKRLIIQSMRTALPRDEGMRVPLPSDLADADPRWRVVASVLDRSAEISARWKRVVGTIDALDTICANTAQMRFLFPALPALLQCDETTKGLGQRLDGFRVPASIPRISDVVREMCRQAPAMISEALLYPPEPAEPRPVAIL